LSHEQRGRKIKETRFRESFDAEEIISEISQIFAIKKKEILGKKRGNIYRQLTLYFLRKFTDLSLNEIGELFYMDYTIISMAVKRFEKTLPL